jgi:hypothetical protein
MMVYMVCEACGTREEMNYGETVDMDSIERHRWKRIELPSSTWDVCDACATAVDEELESVMAKRKASAGLA